MQAFRSGILRASHLLCGITALVSLFLPNRASAEVPCQDLVRNKCGSCHFVTYICPRTEQGKGSFYWKGIVADMVKEGMVATDQEQQQLVRCLASPDRTVKALCPAK
jgi:hypothetical protein